MRTFSIMQAGQAIPPKVWAQVTDVLADYARAGEAYVAAGRPTSGLVAEQYAATEAEYNSMVDMILFSKWTPEQRAEWDRIFRLKNNAESITQLIAAVYVLMDAATEAADYFHDFVESDHEETRLAKIMREAINKAFFAIYGGER